MTRTRRDGLTLVEVLVTIFILGIGLLAILTLFPLAAVNMARAVKDDRAYQLARQTDGLFRAYWKAEIVEKFPTGTHDAVLFNALTNANDSVTDQHTGLNAAADIEPSYPVVVDPEGYIARPSVSNPLASRNWVGDNASIVNVPRRTMRLFTDTLGRDVLSTMYLKDTVGYDEDLRLTADREYRFNSMVIIQRPLNRNQFAANMTIVVFDDRPHLFAPQGVETVHSATFTPGTTVVTVNVPPANLEVVPGNWIMDATVLPPTVTAVTPLVRHANPYQVVSVNPDPNNANVTLLELQSPVLTTDTSTLPRAYTGTLVVLRGVAGVFPRPPLSPE